MNTTPISGRSTSGDIGVGVSSPMNIDRNLPDESANDIVDFYRGGTVD